MSGQHQSARIYSFAIAAARVHSPPMTIAPSSRPVIPCLAIADRRERREAERLRRMARLRADVHVGLTEVGAPSVVDGPIDPTAVAVAAPDGAGDDRRSPPAVDPDAVVPESGMKETPALKTDEARAKANEARTKAGSEAGVKADKAGAKAASKSAAMPLSGGSLGRRENDRRRHRQRRHCRDHRLGYRVTHLAPPRADPAPQSAPNPHSLAHCDAFWPQHSRPPFSSVAS